MTITDVTGVILAGGSSLGRAGKFAAQSLLHTGRSTAAFQPQSPGRPAGSQTHIGGHAQLGFLIIKIA
jgi:hypothetical protein